MADPEGATRPRTSGEKQAGRLESWPVLVEHGDGSRAIVPSNAEALRGKTLFIPAPLEHFTVPVLRRMAASAGVQGSLSRMTKSALVAAIEAATSGRTTDG